jgi:lysophospholipase L1-like esterase
MNIILLGDSTIDNASYTSGGASVLDHLHSLLGPEGAVTILAVDGSMTKGVMDQLSAVPSEATHVFMSVGGNDVMMRVDVLKRSASTVSEALIALAEVAEDFDSDYRRCLRAVLQLGLPTSICTIYNGAFDEETGEQTVITTALRVFNDVIVQAALDAGLTIVDLRRVCSCRSDFANPIEPNVAGGRKIAESVLNAVRVNSTGNSTILPSGEDP